LGDVISLNQLAKRPGVSPELVRVLLPGSLKNVSDSDMDTVLADSLYDGYLRSQKATSDRLYQHDGLKIPDRLTYRQLSGLSNEVVERLERAKPRTFGEARRISGLTPAALSTLLVHLSAAQQKPV
jgi:tRNA uridine 5-carboxymethylaminomethyl modification enzyme